MTNLNENFLIELFKLCFRKREVLEICREYLKYHYLPIEAYKDLWKTIRTDYITSSKIPSIGLISQKFNSSKEEDKAVLEVLAKIKEVEIPDKEEILEQFEDYLKDSMFVELYEKIGPMYNEGDRNKARKILRDESEKLFNFTVKKNAETFEKVFGRFEERQIRRKINADSIGETNIKVPFGIDELDEITGGGIDVTDTALFLAQSGGGKTKFLRWVGVQAARRGFKVLHIQLEGAKNECEDGYDATWTAASIYNIERGSIDDEMMVKLKEVSKQIVEGGGDIYIEAYEKFGKASLLDVRNLIIDFEKVYGEVPHIVLIDYLELLEPGDGKKYTIGEERQRREAISVTMKNLAVEFKTRIVTATQASTVHPTQLNDPEFVMTRYDISEFKGVLKPFSIFVTFNQTKDEYTNGVMRLFTDKLRKKKGSQTIRIMQNYPKDRFYDRRETMLQYHGKNIDEIEV